MAAAAYQKLQQGFNHPMGRQLLRISSNRNRNRNIPNPLLWKVLRFHWVERLILLRLRLRLRQLLLLLSIPQYLKAVGDYRHADGSRVKRF